MEPDPFMDNTKYLVGPWLTTKDGRQIRVIKAKYQGSFPFECDIGRCRRRFTTSENREDHIQTDHMERHKKREYTFYALLAVQTDAYTAFLCLHPGCDLSFNTAVGFVNHIKTHVPAYVTCYFCLTFYQLICFGEQTHSGRF